MRSATLAPLSRLPAKQSLNGRPREAGWCGSHLAAQSISVYWSSPALGRQPAPCAAAASPALPQPLIVPPASHLVKEHLL